jgi:DNA-binding MltR family transcriptional regulator
MASRNRGTKKPKLRDYSSITLSAVDASKLYEALTAPEPHPITTAILGAVMVEHQLDRLLRARFHKQDDDTWQTLVSEQGPLRSFSSKIIAGYAFSTFDERLKDDLGVIRVIRNAFAHSRKLIDFHDPLILKELRSAHNLPKVLARAITGATTMNAARAAYITLCFRVSGKLLQRRGRSILAKNRRLKKKIENLEASPLGQAVIASANPFFGNHPHAFAQQSALARLMSLPPGDQTADPTPEVPQGWLGGVLQRAAKPPDKTDN